MHESTRRGLVRLLRGVAFLAAAIVLVVLAARGCRSEEERVSDAVDAARDALVDRQRDEFLAFFDAEVKYHGKKGFRDLSHDVDRWIEARALRVTILERTIEVQGDRATIRLRCDVGDILRSYLQVAVDLEAVKRDGEWKVVVFDWK